MEKDLEEAEKGHTKLTQACFSWRKTQPRGEMEAADLKDSLRELVSHRYRILTNQEEDK